MRRRREPTEAELALWSEVARSVRPLKARRTGPLKAAAPEVSAEADDKPRAARLAMDKPAAAMPAKIVAKGMPAPTKPAPASVRPAPAMAPLEKRLRMALKRGTRPVEAVMDLHGMRQDEAHAALTAFLHRSASRGAGLVLIVTGKGAGTYGAQGDGHERGVLRRLVPHWLHLPECRALVIGFEEAHQNHGGAGALYVRLRRTRSGTGSSSP